MKFLGKSIRKFGRKRIMPTELTANFGIGFEHRVQTLFAVLLLTEGVWDAFPKYKISSLKFQIARDGYNLDDLLVEFINAESGNKLTLLGQIKSTISCSKDDTDFTDTIQAAWLDFVNTYNMEGMEFRFALIAGPMNMKDTKILPWLLDKARSTGSHEEFLNYIEDPQTTSKEKHKVFALLQAAVGTANNDSFAESRLFLGISSFVLHYNSRSLV